MPRYDSFVMNLMVCCWKDISSNFMLVVWMFQSSEFTVVK